MQKQSKLMVLFINNIAVAARYLQEKYEINKVAIIDFDVPMEMEHKKFFIKIIQLLTVPRTNFLFPGTG